MEETTPITTTPLPPPPVPPPSTQLTTPVAVVGPEYCVDYNVDLTITQKALSLADGDYAITDINGMLVFGVHGKVFTRRRALTDPAGNKILTMKGKLMTMHKRWQIFRGESTESKDLLFSVKKSKLIQFKTELHVFLAANTSEDVCDFKIKGSRQERSVTVFLGNSNGIIIAQMKEQCLFKNSIFKKDMFGLTVHPKVDYAFVAALIVILDDVDHSAAAEEEE